MKERITILIPTYNRGSLIGETLENCFKQTYKNFKIMIYDDGSTDNTEVVVNQYIKRYGSKIKYVKGSHNLGIGEARNILLSNLETEFGIWLDSDDLMRKDRLNANIEYMDSHDVDIVWSDIARFSGSLNDIKRVSTISADISKYDKNDWKSLKSNTTCATACFRKDLQKFKFESRLKLGGEDVLWVWLLLQNNVQLGYISQSLYQYRSHGSRISVQKTKGNNVKLKEDENKIIFELIKNIQNGKY